MEKTEVISKKDINIWETYQKLQNALKLHSLTALEIAGLLYQLKHNDSFRKLGFETWQEFAQSGVGWSKRKCDYYILAFRILVIEYKKPIKMLEGIEISNLRAIAGHIFTNKIEGEKEIDELVKMAETLTHEELITELKLKEMSITKRMECPHDWEYWVGRICKKCKVKESKKTEDSSLGRKFSGTSIPKQKKERDKRIDELINHLKEKMKLKFLDGSTKLNRRYAKLCLDRLEGDVKKVKELINWAGAINDRYYQQNLTSFKFLFTHLASLQKRKEEWD